MLDSVARHLPRALRRLVTAPGFALVIVLTLATAIGANGAVFTLIDQLLLKPLPVSQPDTLVIVNAHSLPVTLKGGSSTGITPLPNGVVLWGMNYPTFRELTERIPQFEMTLAKRLWRATVLVGPTPAEAWGEMVTGNYFKLLGIRPAVGRLIDASDDRPGAPPVVVLSHGYWRRQFGGDTSVVGRTIHISGSPATVIGVAAAGFTGMGGARALDFFVPLEMNDVLTQKAFPLRLSDGGSSSLTMMARLRAGTTIEQAQAAADQIYQQLLADALGRSQFTAKDRAFVATLRLTLLPGGSVGSQQGGVSQQLLLALRLLMIMAVVLLLISAFNVANLLLAREVQRRREIAIRFALGVSRARLLGERLVESLVLALLAGGASLIVAAWLADALLLMLPLAPEQTSVATAPGRQTQVFIAALSLASGVLVWLASSVQATRRSTLPPLSDAGTSEGRTHGLGLRRGLLVVQAGLSVALLCGAAMLAHSLYNLTSVDPGFRTKGLTTFSMQPESSATKAEMFVQPLDTVLDALRARKGVKSAAATTELPALGITGGTFAVGGKVPLHSEKAVLISDVSVTPDYFSTVGLPIVRGSQFGAEARAGGQRVALINESLAKALFDDGDPLGELIGLQSQALDTRVVGVVRDVRAGVRQPPTPTMYVPWHQQPAARASVVVRTDDDRTLDVSTVQGILARVDASMPVTKFASLDDLIADSLARDRMLALLSSAIGAIAAFLCALGLFSIMNYRVVNRTREIGIRLALGAATRSIQWLIVREAVVVIAIAIPAGLAGYIASSRVIGSLIYDLSPTDGATIAGGVCMLVLVTLAAAFVPARRATGLDPAVTLRRE